MIIVYGQFSEWNVDNTRKFNVEIFMNVEINYGCWIYKCRKFYEIIRLNKCSMHIKLIKNNLISHDFLWKKLLLLKNLNQIRMQVKVFS